MAEFRTVLDMFDDRVNRSARRVALRHKAGGAWHDIGFATWNERSRVVAQALIARGLLPGDRVALLSNTTVDWPIIEVGTMMAACVLVPVYPSNPAELCAFILRDSGARIVFVEDPAQLEKVLSIASDVAGLEAIVVCRSETLPEAHEGRGTALPRLQDVTIPETWRHRVVTFDGLRQAHPPTASAASEIDARRKSIGPDSIATLVYTSGTTGSPKGATLTHDNFVYETDAIVRALPLTEEDILLLFLPLAHIFARVAYLACMRVGSVVAIGESVARAVDNLAEVRPTIVPAVPRVFEKLQARILAAARTSGRARARLFGWALELGHDVSKLRQAGREPRGALKLEYALAQRLVFSKLHALLGDRLRFFISGGAPLPRAIGEFFHATGVLVLEGYGLSENTAAATVNRPDRYRFGTVGLPLSGMEVHIAADGEVLLRGRNLMKGYWRDAANTREAIDGEGWLHTGDVGELDSDGFLRITDRKKDLIVTANGKKIAPQNIESHLQSSPYLSQVMVYGDGRPYCVALVTLDEARVREWAAGRDLRCETLSELTRHAEVFKLVEHVIDEKNRTLASYESIKKFAILERDFTQENEELTPTLKVRRKVVAERHRALLESIYNEAY